MSGYQPYPAYKPSGSEWLGDVPKEWDIVALKYVSRIVNGGTPSSGESYFWDGDIIWYTPEDLGKNQKKTIECSRRKLTQDGIENSGANLVPEHSVILSTRAPIGHVAITNVKAATNQGCKSLVSGKLYHPDFLYYCITSFREPLQAAGKGTTFLELSATNLGQHTCPLPEYVEQKAIADFLDRETAKIDALAAKKRELIDRLKEKRAVLITRTVTRGLPSLEAEKHGLNPNPPLKPSGSEWLGDVPEHWEVKPIKTLSRLFGRIGFRGYTTEDMVAEGEGAISLGAGLDNVRVNPV